MARTNNKAELFSHLSTAYILRETTGTHGDTTVGTAVAAGDTTVTVAAATNFVDGDWFRVGSGNNQEVCRVDGAPAGNVITVRNPFHFAHEVGEQAIELTRMNLGHLTDDGLRPSFPGDSQAVNSATRRLVVGYLDGHAELIGEFNLEGFNLENFATAFGMAESGIVGAGTEADPYRLVLDPSNFGNEPDMDWHFAGVLKNGDTVLMEYWGVEVDWTAVSSALARGQVASIPVRIRATAAIAIQRYT